MSGFQVEGGHTSSEPISINLYRNNLKNRFLTASALLQISGLHSRLAVGNGHSLQTQKFAQLPSQIPDSSDHFGITVIKIFLLFEGEKECDMSDIGYSSAIST